MLRQQYSPLATITPSRIELLQEGLNVLDEFDFCSIITLYGNLQSFPISVAEQGRLAGSNCIIIQKNPFYSTRLKRYVIALRIMANDARAFGVAHTLCTLISHAVVIGDYENQNLQYLNAPSAIIVEKEAMPRRISSLVGLTEDGQSIDIVQNSERIKQALERQGVQPISLAQIYPDCSSFQLPIQQSKTQPALLHIVENLIESNAANSNVLMHGQVIEEYMAGLVDQFNSSGTMMPSRAEEEIQVDEYFDDYLAAVERYNAKCKNALGNESQSDIEGNLRQIRYQTQQEQVFLKSPHYAKKIGRYMGRKELQLSSLNEQFNDTYNLNLLQKESVKSLEAVGSSKNLSQQDVTKQIDRLIARYNQKSRGSNRHKLLTEFMQVFVPTIYAQAGVNNQVDKKITNLTKENKNLQEQIAKLQKKNNKCCTIM